MDMTILKDIVELAKAGYKPADVKELVTLMKEPEPAKDPEPAKEPETVKEVKDAVDAFEKLINDNKK